MTLINTPKHDALHLWLYDERNRFKMLEKVAAKKGFELDKDSYTSNLEIEKPIFSPNQTRRFIVDSIIDISKHCPTNGGYRLISARSFSGKEIKVTPGIIYRRVIADLKPALLNSISHATGQLKSYNKS